MICKNCNNTIADDARFCGFCGTKVEREPVMAGAPAPTIPAVEPVAQPVPTPVESAPAAQPVPTPVESAPAAQPVQLEKPAPSMETPAAAFTQPAAAVKKKAPVVPIIIAALAVILVIAGTLMYFFGRSTVMRLFMGEERYAVSTVTDYFGNVTESDPIISTLMKSGTNYAGSAAEVVNALAPKDANTSQPSSVDSGSILSVSSENGAQMADAIAKIAGTQGVTVDLSADIKLDKSVEKSLGGSEEFVNAVIALINSTELSTSAKTGDATQMSVAAKKDGSELFTANAYIDADGNIYTTLPDILDKPIFVKASVSAEDENESGESAKNVEIDREKLSELYNKIIKAWEKAYENAEFTYDKAEFTVGDAEYEKTFKGTRVSVSLSQEDVCGLLIEVLNLVNEDSYVEELVEAYGGDVDMFHDYIDNSISSLEDAVDNDDLSLKFTIDSYVTAANKPCGVEISISYKNYDQKQSIVLSSLSADGNTAVSVAANKTKLLEVVSTKTGAGSGIFEAELNTSNTEKKPVGARIEYSGIKTESVLGTDAVTGKFEISANVKSMKDELSKNNIQIGETTLDLYTVVSKSKLTIDSAKEGDGLKLTFGADINKLGTGSFNIAIKPASGEIASAPADIDNVYDQSALSGADGVEIQLSSLNYLKGKVQADNDLATVLSGAGLSVSDIDEQIKTLEQNKSFYEHYSEYDPNTSAETAYEAAQQLYADCCYNDNSVPYTDYEGKTFTLKIWFDKNGKMSVIDPDGFSYNWEKVFGSSNYRNTYAEITVLSGNFEGVCAVLTDDYASLPSKLPNCYNYIDGVFEYDDIINSGYSCAGVKDSFVVAAYPMLDIGESTTEKTVNEQLALVDDYNDYAQKAYDAFNKFLTAHRAVVEQDYKNWSFYLNVSDSGEWNDSDYYRTPLQYMFTEDLSDYAEQLFSQLASATSGLKSAKVVFYLRGGSLCGVAVTDKEQSPDLGSIDFVLGGTNKWVYGDGVAYIWGSIYAVGTYPVLPSMSNAQLLNKALDCMAGRWYVEYDSENYYDENSAFEFTADDLRDMIPSDARLTVYSNEAFITTSDGTTIFDFYSEYNTGDDMLRYAYDTDNWDYILFTRNPD